MKQAPLVGSNGEKVLLPAASFGRFGREVAAPLLRESCGLTAFLLQLLHQSYNHGLIMTFI
jgi:hypothetical protein